MFLEEIFLKQIQKGISTELETVIVLGGGKKPHGWAARKWPGVPRIWSAGCFTKGRAETEAFHLC
jgi:hypothetical protein